MARTKQTVRDTTDDPGIARAYLNHHQRTAGETSDLNFEPDREANPSTDLNSEPNMRIREQDKQKKKRGNDLSPVVSPPPRNDSDKYLTFTKRGTKRTQKQKTLPQTDGPNENVEEESIPIQENQIQQEPNQCEPNETVEEDSIPIQENEIQQEPNQSEEENGESEEEESAQEDDEEETVAEEVTPLSQEQPTQPLALPPPEPRIERKARKPRTKEPQPKGKHIPPPEDETFWLPAPPKGMKHWGEARDGNKVLFGYPWSYAAKVASARDHKRLALVLKHSRPAVWDLELECDKVQRIVKEKALQLYNASIHTQDKYDGVTVSALRERYWPETGTLHFGFGEMALIPDDAKQIKNLETHGNHVFLGDDNKMKWGELNGLAMKVFGWSQNQCDEEWIYGGGGEPGVFVRGKPPAKSKKILSNRLWLMYGNTKQKGKELSDEEATRVAKAWMLHTLGTVLFPDSSGNRVNACYLKYIDDIDTVDGYAWGTAVIAFLNASLAKASRAKTTKIEGDVRLLQSWFYDHFPSLAPKEDSDWVNKPEGTPTGKRFPFKESGLRSKEALIVEKRQQLDAFPLNDVVFDPYVRLRPDEEGGLEDMREFSQESSYTGPLFHPSGFHMYNPQRVMRQLCYEQPIVREEKFVLQKRGSKLDSSKCKLVYDPEPSVDHWAARETDDYQLALNIESFEANIVDVEEGYLEWFNKFGHPMLINIDPRASEAIQKEQERLTRNTASTSSEAPMIASLKKKLKQAKENVLLVASRLTPCIQSGKKLSVEEQRVIQNQLNVAFDPKHQGVFDELRKTRNKRGPPVRQASPSSAEEDEGFDEAQGRGRGRGGGKSRGASSSSSKKRGKRAK